MADGLEELERTAGALLRSLSPAERRGLLRKMARTLQRSQSSRIAAQRNPDGSAYEPRKPQPLRKRAGGVRRKAMFTALRRAKHLQSGSDDRSLWVGFSGRASRIASVHQFGLRDRPSPRAQAMAYPRRELIGATDAEAALMLNTLFQHIAAA